MLYSDFWALETRNTLSYIYKIIKYIFIRNRFCLLMLLQYLYELLKNNGQHNKIQMKKMKLEHHKHQTQPNKNFPTYTTYPEIIRSCQNFHNSVL